MFIYREERRANKEVLLLPEGPIPSYMSILSNGNSKKGKENESFTLNEVPVN